MTSALPRVIVLWIPDWPIIAFTAEKVSQGHEHADPATAQHPTDPAQPPDPALALISRREVVACSPAARAEGVRAGQREREAQSLCPFLEVHPHDPAVDERHFLRVIAALEKIIPEVEPLRPGLSAMRARGPARYFGSETLAAVAVLKRMDALGLTEARVGVACGTFTATEAARSSITAHGVSTPHERIRVVTEHDTLPFLGRLPVTRACSPDLASTLQGLGIRTLAQFAALPVAAVRERFGPYGEEAYRRATAQPAPHTSANAEVRPRTPPAELDRSIEFESPIDTAEQLAFACRPPVDSMLQALRLARLVCTEVRIELTDDVGVRHERVWAHPRHFDAADVLGRLRWQSAALARDTGRGGAGITRVCLSPVRTDRAASHEPGLWSTEPDARVHHHLQRVQSLVGHAGVTTAELTGGRLSHERVRLIPWGERLTATESPLRRRRAQRSSPWPGQLQAPLPSTVFPHPPSATLTDHASNPVRIDAADLLTAAPVLLSVSSLGVQSKTLAWSSPWPLREQWWRARPTRFRMQLVTETGDAWLLRYEHAAWCIEGSYD